MIQSTIGVVVGIVGGGVCCCFAVVLMVVLLSLSLFGGDGMRGDVVGVTICGVDGVSGSCVRVGVDVCCCC